MGYFVDIDKNQHPDFVTKRQAPRGGVVLDVNHPLYSALDELYLPINNRMVALKSNEFTSNTGTLPGVDQVGRHIDRSETDAIDAGAAPHVNSSGYNMSVVTYYSTTDNLHTIAARRDGSTVQWQFYVFQTAPAISIRIGATANDMVTTFVSSKWYDGKPHVIGLSTTSSDGYLYYEGTQEDNVSLSGTASGTAVNLAIGSRWESYPTVGFAMDAGKIYLQMYFNRALTDVEHKSLSDDPFQLLKPSVPLQFYTPTVGGVVTNPKGPFFHPFYGPFRGPIS